MNNKEFPVYLFVGFLFSGKTTFIKDSLNDPRMNPEGMRTLLLVCEDGEEEYDKEELEKMGVYLEVIDDAARLTPDRLAARAKRCKAERAFVEFNGMWQLDDFYYAMPENWLIYQQTMFVDAPSIMGYNSNMRQLVYDKLNNSDVVIFNRLKIGEDVMPYHKLVRGASRSAAIFYDFEDHSTMKDDIKDPLPYDINAEVVEIADKDFAIWFSDMSDNMADYDGLTVKYLGMVAKQPEMPAGYIAVGRHIMTCCADDIAYNGLACKMSDTEGYSTYDWVEITGKLKIEHCPLYNGNGPVVYPITISPSSEPEEPVATFY